MKTSRRKFIKAFAGAAIAFSIIVPSHALGMNVNTWLPLESEAGQTVTVTVNNKGVITPLSKSENP